MGRKSNEDGKFDFAVAIKRILVLTLAFVMTVQFSSVLSLYQVLPARWMKRP